MMCNQQIICCGCWGGALFKYLADWCTSLLLMFVLNMELDLCSFVRVFPNTLKRHSQEAKFAVTDKIQVFFCIYFIVLMKLCLKVHISTNSQLLGETPWPTAYCGGRCLSFSK